MVKKRSIQETVVAEPVAVEHARAPYTIHDLLEEIKTYEGVIGYIQRNSKSASIDLKDPTKLVNYALLSSATMDTATQIAGLFDMGETKSVVLNGKDAKMLCLTINEDKISVLFENNAEVDRVLKKLTS